MTYFVFCFILQRMIHPLILCTCIAIRPGSIASLAYLSFIFAIPHTSIVTSKKTSKRFFYMLIGFSLLTLSLQMVLFLLCFANTTWKVVQFTTSLSRYLGFVECFNELNDYWSVIQVIGPDSIVTSSTIILISLTKKFTSFRKEENERLRKIFVLSKNYEKSFEASENGYLNYQKFRKVITIVSIISIGLAGAVEPSILNSIYFVSFLIIATWLGVNRDYQKKFAVFLKILSFLLIVHITAILLYQNKWFEHEINDQNWYERLLGLDLYYISDNSNKLFQLTLNNELQIDDFFESFCPHWML
ncbi:CLUMA_CG013368, isoform A [Clunio marinus]|uniref:CLUMA_CG013368, isoform A n=1 Tax=Clunio marinus TaxID=568069 RepID=A0A1J1ILZ0_9DIPT|nr:CLUMA_CG013368, isoform A [Clunio marinus]